MLTSPRADAREPQPFPASLPHGIPDSTPHACSRAPRALLHPGLYTSLRRRALQQSALIDLRQQRRNEARRQRLRARIGLAAACFCAAAFLWLNAVSAGVKVEVLASKDSSSEEFGEGGNRRIKTLRLAQGCLHLRLPSGVCLKITSPAQLT